MLKSDGYRATFLWTGVIQGLVILIVAQVLRHPSRGAGRDRGATAAPAPPGTRRTQHFTTGEMMRTPQFWMMYRDVRPDGDRRPAAHAQHRARSPHSWGIAAGALTVAASLNAVANGASRVFWGWVSDKTGREAALIVAFILQAACLLLVTTVGRVSGTWFAVTLVLTSFHLGRDLLAVPRDARGLLRHPPCHVELRRAVHRQGRGLDFGGWVARA